MVANLVLNQPEKIPSWVLGQRRHLQRLEGGLQESAERVMRGEWDMKQLETQVRGMKLVLDFAREMFAKALAEGNHQPPVLDVPAL